MQSVMTHQFSQVPQADIPRSSFNRTHGHKTTFDSGFLVPFYVDEALPGDTFNLNCTMFARLASPLNVPIMDNMHLDTFFFFVPNRLLWKNWKKLHGEQDNPGDSIDYLCPQISAPVGGWQAHSLADYFGIKTGVANIKATSFHHRAYNLIYNEWFRDQNLISSATVVTDDTGDLESLYPLRRRTKRHDYFTSCLPAPQKGPGVNIPLGQSAPVVTQSTEHHTTGLPPLLLRSDTGNKPSSSYLSAITSGGNLFYTNTAGTLAGGSGNGMSPTNLYADLSSATSATINTLRLAFQLQRLAERDMRGGTRYTEIVRSHFGVVSPDARLQRPEYLGGSSTPIVINPVVQMAPGGSTPQANLSAYGFSAHSTPGFTKSFTEHGVLIGLVNVRADLTYQDGIPRMFSRKSRFDFYYPALAHIGEQAVLNKEIYAQGTSADDNVFGYQERWAEYRYFPSKITGKLRSSDAQSLDVWHLSQEFSSLPTLSQTFIEENPPIPRISAVTNEPQFILDSYFDLTCVRPMPTYSVPGMMDHF